MPTDALDTVLSNSTSTVYMQMTRAIIWWLHSDINPAHQTAEQHVRCPRPWQRDLQLKQAPMHVHTCSSHRHMCVHAYICCINFVFAHIISCWMKEQRFNFDLHHVSKRYCTQILCYTFQLTGCWGSVWVGEDSVSSPESSSGSCHTLTIPSSAPVASKQSWNGEKVKSVRKAEWAAIMGKRRKRPWLCRGSTATEPTPKNNVIAQPH